MILIILVNDSKSEWVINFNSLSRTVDSEVHLMTVRNILIVLNEWIHISVGKEQNLSKPKQAVHKK